MPNSAMIENERNLSAALIGERYPTVFDIIFMVITVIICPSSAYEYMACVIIKVSHSP